MFPTELYSHTTLLHEDFIHEVAQKLIAAFKSADAQTQEQMIVDPALPSKLKTYPAEQEEVNGQMITFPDVINLVSEDEEEIDENDYEDPASEHPKDGDKKRDDDDDENPTPGAGGIQQGNKGSGAQPTPSNV